MAVKQTYLDDDDAEVDVSLARPQPTITTSHLRVHQGKLFHTSYLVPHGSEITNDATANILFVTAGSSAHSIFTVNTAGDTEIHITEGVAVTANGVELPRYSNNRIADTTSLSIPYVTPVEVTGGTELGQGVYIAAGSGGNASGGNETFDHEIMFKPNTNYLISITNRSGGAIQFSMEIGWYEP